jgi:hypothetical protein
VNGRRGASEGLKGILQKSGFEREADDYAPGPWGGVKELLGMAQGFSLENVYS